MMKYRLKGAQVSTLAKLLNIEESIITLLLNDGLLDLAGVRAVLIKHDYENMLLEGILKKTNIVSALMKKYKLSRSSVEKIIYKKTKIHINKKTKSYE